MVDKTFDLEDYVQIVNDYYRDSTKQGTSRDGKAVQIEFKREWAIDAKSGEFIFNLVKAIKPDKTLEVGLAQGASTLHFLSALTFNQHGQHTAIDPLQDGFMNIGLNEVKRFGLSDRLRFFPERSDVVLPRLRAEGETFQVCLIDGDHRFDAVFTDFYHIDKILDVGGVILFDEVGSQPTEKVISFIRNNLKNYEFLENTPKRFHVIKKLDQDKRDWADSFDF